MRATMTIGLWAGLAASVTGCGFEDSKPPVVEPAPLAGRWCRPVDRVLEVDGRVLEASWLTGETVVVVERLIDGTLFERQIWELSDVDGHLMARTIETPDVLDDADLAFVRAHALDALQALNAAADPWVASLPIEGDACDTLPSAYGHGYPLAEGWYVAGAASIDLAATPGSEWYGHGGETQEAPFAPAKSKLIEIVYDDAERMTEERLDRGAVDGGPHNLIRTRTFDPDGVLSQDRVERWSPTPKEDVVRVLSYASAGPQTLERSLLDTFESLLEVRYILRPMP